MEDRQVNSHVRIEVFSYFEFGIITFRQIFRPSLFLTCLRTKYVAPNIYGARQLSVGETLHKGRMTALSREKYKQNSLFLRTKDITVRQKLSRGTGTGRYYQMCTHELINFIVALDMYHCCINDNSIVLYCVNILAY